MVCHQNLGTLTMSGADLVQKDAGSSAIDNGWYNNKGNDLNLDYPSSASVSLTINGGTFSGRHEHRQER